MRKVGRRRFLCVLAGTTAAAGIGAAQFQAGRANKQAGGTHPGQKLIRVQRTSWALGSNISLTALHEDTSRAEAALDAAFDELERVENLMSIYRTDSQLSRLNQEGFLHEPHPYLIEVLLAARQMSERTGGAFDVTVQPLWALYWHAAQRGEMPAAAEVQQARARIDWRRVEINRRAIRLRGQDTAITLNGIAQGFAADRVAATLRQHGIQHALIDTGELGSVGANADGEQWSVGIQHPRQPDAFVAIAKLAGRCLATSGDYATKFSGDFRHHHLLDPRSGDSPSDLSSVSITADTALAADALSTAVFVLGCEDGMQLIRETPGTDAMLITKEGRVRVTPGFPIDV